MAKRNTTQTAQPRPLGAIDGRALLRQALSTSRAKIAEILAVDYNLEVPPGEPTEKLLTDAIRVYGEPLAADIVGVLQEVDHAAGKMGDKAGMIGSILGSVMSAGGGIAQAIADSKSGTGVPITSPAPTAPAGTDTGSTGAKGSLTWILIAAGAVVAVVALIWVLNRKKGATTLK